MVETAQPVATATAVSVGSAGRLGSDPSTAPKNTDIMMGDKPNWLSSVTASVVDSMKTQAGKASRLMILASSSAGTSVAAEMPTKPAHARVIDAVAERGKPLVAI